MTEQEKYMLEQAMKMSEEEEKRKKEEMDEEQKMIEMAMRMSQIESEEIKKKEAEESESGEDNGSGLGRRLKDSIKNGFKNIVGIANGNRLQ